MPSHRWHLLPGHVGRYPDSLFTRATHQCNIYAGCPDQLWFSCCTRIYSGKTFLEKRIAGFSSILKEHWNYASWLLGTALLPIFLQQLFPPGSSSPSWPPCFRALRIAQNLFGLTHVLFQAMENVVPVKAAESLCKGRFYSHEKIPLETEFSIRDGCIGNPCLRLP